MSNISGQLIKDSYNYILQSDVNTGFVYRVGGGVPSNPIFSSGLTISGAAFTYVDGNQQAGYVLTSDASGNAAWGPISGSSTGNFVEISGSTMTGRLYNQSGITVTGDVTTDYVIAKGITATTISATTLHIENAADISAGSITADTYSGNTIIVNNFTAITVSATTYLNLPDSADTKVTGFSLNNNVITLSQNRTDQYSAFTISLSAYTGNTSSSGDYLPLSGGTVTGNTIFQSGLTANTISATTYYNLPDNVTGKYLPLSGGTVTGNTIFQSGLTANTISATTYYNLPIDPDTYVTGLTLSSNTITLSQNRTDQYSAFTISLSAYTGTSVSGLYLPLSGGTVTGATIFQSGLTANTISATTYYNLPSQSGTGISAFSYNQSTGILTITKNDTTSLTAGTFSYVTATTLSAANVLSVASNGTSATTTTINAVTGGTYSNGIITLSGTGSVNGNQITGLSALTPTTLYSGDGTLSGNRIVNLSSYTLNFSSSTNPDTLVMSGGSVGIGTTSLPGKFNIDLNNTNYTNTSGADSHILMTNPNGTGQNVISSVINGSVVAKWRTDYIGNINWIAGTTGTHAFYTGGDFGVGRGQMCIFNNGNVKFETTTIGGSSVDGGYKVDVIGISRFSATTDPLKLEGVQTSTDTELLTIDGSGVVHKVSTSSITGSFLRNKTHSGATDTIQINESIFNPADLTVLSTSIFIVDTDADYYILGDLYNNGSIIVNGTLKVGGIIYNYGSITGPGIIE